MHQHPRAVDLIEIIRDLIGLLDYWAFFKGA